MTTPIYLSKKAFADRINRSPSYVTQLKDSNRLVLAPDGKKVDVLATEALILETIDPSKAGVAARHQQGRTERHGSSGQPGALSVPHTRAGDSKFQESRALREHNLAQLAGIDLQERQGLLVERSRVEIAAYNAGRLLRDQLFGPLPQMAHELAAMTDPWLIEKHLAAIIRRTLEEAERLSSADLEHALTQN